MVHDSPFRVNDAGAQMAFQRTSGANFLHHCSLNTRFLAPKRGRLVAIKFRTVLMIRQKTCLETFAK